MEQSSLEQATSKSSFLPLSLRRWDRWMMPVVDIALINLAFLVAYWMRYNLQWFAALDPVFNHPASAYIPFALGMTVLLMLVFTVGGVYRTRRGTSWLEEVTRVFNGSLRGAVALWALTFFTRPLVYSRLLLFEAWGLIVIFLSLARLLRREIENGLRRRGIGIQRLLIIGVGDVGLAVMRNVVAHPDLGYRVVGFIDDDPERGQMNIGRFKALGELKNLARVLTENRVNHIIITLPWSEHQAIQSIVTQCEVKKVRVQIVPDLLQLSLNRVDIDNLAGLPLIGFREPELGRSSRLLKRATDLTLALLALIPGLPLMALIAVAIKLDSPGPVIFEQTRVGKGEKLFSIYKFRSMRVGAEAEQEFLREQNEADGPLFKIRNDPRLTRVGRWLRRLSLDELPQLFNVLGGDMSLVGPRPAVPGEVAQYQTWHRQRLAVAPGMTGLWQVSGRSDMSFDEGCLLDIYYVENWSLELDLQILLRTLPRVLMARGAY